MATESHPDPASNPSASIPIPASEYEETVDEEVVIPGRRFGFLRDAPAWLVSMLLHVLILLALGLITFTDPIKIVNVLTANSSSEEGPEIEEFTIDEIDPGDVAEMEEPADPIAELTEPMELTETVDVAPVEMSAVVMDMGDLAAEMAPPTMSLQSLATMTSQPLSSRSEDMKKKLLRDYGGNESSEAAVTEALKWFSRHQMPNGGWTFAHNYVCNGACGDPGDENRAKAVSAATAMALLPFLGAGQTHLQGDFKNVVGRGLQFLIQSGKAGKANGLAVLDLRSGGDMYSHGLAAIALCEAYAMTEDPILFAPAQGAVNFIVAAQCRDGGWRYKVQDPRGGDTSVAGWQIMALKSGYMGHLSVPPMTIQQSVVFLNRVQSNNGSIYGYDKPETKYRAGTTAIGLLCRMYTGWDKTHPGIVEGVKLLSKTGVKKNDLYYNYYAAQVLRQFGGIEWDNYNTELRDWLVTEQSQKAGAKGSWFIKSSVHGMTEGGRLMQTSFATMILEVYYRHMPLYADAASEDDFPL
ncbi:MAG: prenyltransferase/squalene oxidase repeat-containing protein [Rubripirellula sp.]